MLQGEDRAADRVDEALASGSEDEVVATLAELGVRFVLFHRDQPTSEVEEPLFEGQLVVFADRRLALYEEQTAPLIAWYLATDRLAAVDGIGSPDAVTGRLLRAIDNRLARR